AGASAALVATPVATAGRRGVRRAAGVAAVGGPFHAAATHRGRMTAEERVIDPHARGRAEQAAEQRGEEAATAAATAAAGAGIARPPEGGGRRGQRPNQREAPQDDQQHDEPDEDPAPDGVDIGGGLGLPAGGSGRRLPVAPADGAAERLIDVADRLV